MKEVAFLFIIILLCINVAHSMDILPLNTSKKQALTAVTTSSALQTIVNHGGPMTPQSVTIYTIMYGTRFSSTTAALLKTFYGSVGSSSWANNINSYYPSGHITITGGAIVVNSYSVGYTISDSSIQSLISSTISKGGFGSGAASEIYLFLFDYTVKYSGFGSSWCGYHSFYKKSPSVAYTNYMVAGSPLGCASTCSVLNALGTNAPNNNFEFDSLVNVIAHEIAEIMTDPQDNAWYFSSTGNENADQCQWTFGAVQLSNSRYYNEVMGSNKYLIQQVWNKNTQQCSQ
jgi:hypothetical protein